MYSVSETRKWETSEYRRCWWPRRNLLQANKHIHTYLVIDVTQGTDVLKPLKVKLHKHPNINTTNKWYISIQQKQRKESDWKWSLDVDIALTPEVVGGGEPGQKVLWIRGENGSVRPQSLPGLVEPCRLCTGPWPSPWSGQQWVQISKPKNCHSWCNRGETLSQLFRITAQLNFVHITHDSSSPRLARAAWPTCWWEGTRTTMAGCSMMAASR